MRIIEGDLAGSQVKINQDNARLEIHARLMVAAAYQLPQDMQATTVLSKKNYHSLEQWLVMIVLALTGVGLLISIPMYLLAKTTQFQVRFSPKRADSFIVEGNREDWKELKPYLS